MYYKIVNKECVVYKKLHKLRTDELLIEAENEILVKKKIGLNFESFLGDNNQQSFGRVLQYIGFKFTSPDDIDLKVWKKHSEYKEIYIPNKKSSGGREIEAFLFNGLNRSSFDKVWDILELIHIKKFTFPYVEIVDDNVLVFLDDRQIPKDLNVIEITKTEFNQLLSIT